MIPALPKYLFCAVLLIIAFWSGKIAISNINHNRVYMAARQDRLFLDLIGKAINDKINARPGQPFPISELVDQDRIAELENEGFHPDRYSGYLSDRNLLIYRTDPALKRESLIKNASSAFQFSYDPTNGIYSQGFIFKIIQIK